LITRKKNLHGMRDTLGVHKESPFIPKVEGNAYANSLTIQSAFQVLPALARASETCKLQAPYDCRRSFVSKIEHFGFFNIHLSLSEPMWISR
jgi:hypothetical protein